MLSKRYAPARLAYYNTNTIGRKQTLEVLISKITMCQSPEKRQNNIIKEQ